MNRAPGTTLAREDGAVAVIVALTLFSFILVAAIVVDLGLLRSDRIATKSVTDMSTAAAVSLYEPAENGGPLEACLAALRYADTNIASTDLLGPGTAVTSCADAFPSDATCAALSPLGSTAVYEAGAYRLEITIPVPEGSPLLAGFDHDVYDGSPCQRVGVSLTRNSTAVFAGFVGDGIRSVESVTVGRGGAGPRGEEYASLIVLQADGCGTLATDGNPTLIEIEGVTIDGEYFPGTATVDTATACTSPTSGRIFQPSNGSAPGIRATDGVYSNGLRLGSARVLPDNADKTIDAGTTGGVVPGNPITRLNVDDRYNCLDPYPTGKTWSPASWPSLTTAQGGPGPSPACDLESEIASEYPYIQLLHTAYQGLTPAAALDSTAWSVYPDDLAAEGAACRATGGDRTDFVLGPAPNETGGSDGSQWFINCPGVSQATTLQPDGLKFVGVDAVVASGPIEVTNSFDVIGSSTQGAVLYLQSGNFERSGNTSTVVLRDTFVYIDDGSVLFGSSSSTPLIWDAPLGATIQSSCDSYGGAGAPPAGCFSPLALWSKGSELHNMSGGVQLTIAGTFFTPNARFRLGGGNDQVLNQAQFFAGSLTAAGNSTVTLQPNPDTNIPSPAVDLRILLR